MEYLQGLLASALANFPGIVEVLAIVGVLRVINKPLLALLHAYTGATSSTADDALLNNMEQSKIYTGFLFVLDWLGSIKVQPKA